MPSAPLASGIVFSVVTALVLPVRGAVVADFRSDFSSTPTNGWHYYWNAPAEWSSTNAGMPESHRLRNTLARLTPLKWAGSRYTPDGIAAVPKDGAGFLFLQGTGGHTGLAGTTAQAARYIVIGYTVPEAGRYQITRSAYSKASSTDFVIEVYLKSSGRMVRRYVASGLSGASFPFDTELGELAAGEEILVALGPGDSPGYDTFSLNYSISRVPANAPNLQDDRHRLRWPEALEHHLPWLAVSQAGAGDLERPGNWQDAARVGETFQIEGAVLVDAQGRLPLAAATWTVLRNTIQTSGRHVLTSSAVSGDGDGTGVFEVRVYAAGRIVFQTPHRNNGAIETFNCDLGTLSAGDEVAVAGRMIAGAATHPVDLAYSIEVVEPQHAAFRQVFRPEQFGARGDGVADDGAAVQQALDAAVTAGAAGRTGVLLFGTNRTYRLVASPTVWELGIRVGLYLNGARNVLIEGNGSHLILRTPNRFAVIKRCEDVTLRNLTIRYDPQPYVQTVATGNYSLSENWIDVRVPTNQPLPDLTLSDTAYNPHMNGYRNRWHFARAYGNGYGAHLFLADVTRPDPARRVLRLHGAGTGHDAHVDANRATLPVGWLIANGAYGQNGGNTYVVQDSARVLSENLTWFNYPHFGIGPAHNTGPIQFRNVNFVRERPDIYITGWRDAFHVNGNQSAVLIADCEVDSTYDDDFNFKSTYLTAGGVRTEAGVSQVDLTASLQRGDRLLFATAGLVEYGFAKVAAVEGRRVTLDRVLPQLQSGDQIIRLFDSNEPALVTRYRGRGTYTSSRLRTPTTFDHCVTGFLWPSQGDPEGPSPRKMSFRNSTISRTAHQAATPKLATRFVVANCDVHSPIQGGPVRDAWVLDADFQIDNSADPITLAADARFEADITRNGVTAPGHAADRLLHDARWQDPASLAFDFDYDGDGLPNFADGFVDDDGDGLRNFADPDSDGDGEPDGTDRHPFGSRGLSPAVQTGYGAWSNAYRLVQAPAGDDDADGVSNLYEYGLGGNPTNSFDRGHEPDYGLVEVAGTNWFYYIHPQLSDSHSGIRYHLELTHRLLPAAWTNAGYEITGTNVNGFAAGLDAVTNRLATALHRQQFLRLIIVAE